MGINPFSKSKKRGSNFFYFISSLCIFTSLSACQVLPPAPKLASSEARLVSPETFSTELIYELPKPISSLEKEKGQGKGQGKVQDKGFHQGFAGSFNPQLELKPDENFVPTVRMSGPIALGKNDEALLQTAGAIQALAEEKGFDLQHLSFIWQSQKTPQLALSLNIERQHIAASTIKLPLAIIALDAVASGDFNLQTKLSYRLEDYEGGSGILGKPKIGQVFSLKKLLELSIVHSDNIATNMILRWVKTYTGTSALQQIHNRFGIPVSESENKATVAAMTMVLKELNLNPKQNPYYPYLQNWLRQSTMTYLGQKFPVGLTYQHKYGLYQNSYGEVLFVEGKKPFYLSLYWDNVQQKSEKEVLDFLGELGYLFYAYNDAQN